IGALKFGSFSWLLDTIQHHGFDKAEGIDIDRVPLASTEATRVGLLSHSLDLRAELRRDLFAFQRRTCRSHGATQFGHHEFGCPKGQAAWSGGRSTRQKLAHARRLPSPRCFLRFEERDHSRVRGSAFACREGGARRY